ncbi:MAG: redoxin domain-containing protein [Prevotella sp.]|nr:redoxin domain-containing protein [Prevotella sp.]
MIKSNISFCTGLFFVFLVLFSCNRKASTFEITGKLDNISGNYFFMSHEAGDSLIIDTIPVSSKGEFSFSGAVDTLTEMSLYFNQNTKVTYLLVNKGWHVDLKGDVLYPDLINIKGGDVNDDLTDFKNKNKGLLKSRADIVAAGNDSLAVKDYVVELKNINFELSNIAANYVKANPDKIASVMLINTFFKDESSIPRLDENLGLLKGKAADFPLTANLKRFRDKVKMSAIGTMAPIFSTEDTKGKKINLSDYRGKYVSLSFISTTCKICMAGKKDVIDVYNKLKSKKYNIEFITVVKDIEEAPVDSMASSVKWPVLPVKGGWSANLFDTYYIREIPYNILISPTGIILERDYPVLVLPGKMEESLQN